MKLSLIFAAAALLVSGEESRRTVEKTFPLPAGGVLEVCNINGSIRIEPGGGGQVRFSIAERLEAPSRERLSEIQKETDVVFRQDGSRLKAGVKGPWSSVPCGEKESGERRSWNSGRGVEITHEITVSAPLDAKLEINTVNGGIEIKETRADYRLRTVNGSVKLMSAIGSGSVSSVNGSLSVVYGENPRADTQFKTVNGKIDLYLQPSLNADFHMKTVNGSAYTDFDMTAIGDSSGTSSRSSNGKIVYRRGNSIAMRAGNGGPKLTAETVNGSVMLHSLAKGRP